MAKFLKFSTFLFESDIDVEISYRPHQPHFRIAFFTSYNFFFGCQYQRLEKVGQKNCFLTSTTDFLVTKCQRLMFLTIFGKNRFLCGKDRVIGPNFSKKNRSSNIKKHCSFYELQLLFYSSWAETTKIGSKKSIFDFDSLKNR